MLKQALAPWLLVVAAVPGCGGSDSPLKAGGPHQGVLIKLPGDRGVAELVIETLAKPPSRSAPNELVLYFLAPDLSAPMATPPTEATLKILDPESRQKAPRKLRPAPKSSDPSGSGRFATGPIERDYSNFSIGGDLEVTFNGETIVTPF